MATTAHAALWDKYMRSYDFLQNVDSYNQSLADIVQSLHPATGERILDAGSGTGNLSLLLKSMGAEVVSCDFSRSALNTHRAKDPHATLINASLEEVLPFDAGEFHSVACASVLFTLSQTGCRLALAEFYRILKPGGRLVVTAAATHQRNQNLVGMHWASLSKRHGKFLGAASAIRDIPAIARILYYNSCLARLPDWNGFHRFTDEELKQSVLRAGFTQCVLQHTYGGCLYLVSAVKE